LKFNAPAIGGTKCAAWNVPSKCNDERHSFKSGAVSMGLSSSFAAAILLTVVGGHATVAQTVTARKNLAFGKISGDHDVTGTVTISPSGVKSTTGGAFNQGGTVNAAQFRVSGTARRQIAITLPASFNMTVNGKTVAVTNLTHDCANPCRIAANGRVDINVGAKVTLLANQSAGSYSSAFTFTAIYD
jgi:hypothetical protein